MNYDSIILELLERVQNLEKEVKELKEGTSVKPIENMTGKTNTQLAREYIQQQKEEARTKGEGRKNEEEASSKKESSKRAPVPGDSIACPP